jgi:hypothetical protein
MNTALMMSQTEMHTAQPLVPELDCFEVDIPIGKLERYESPGTDQTPSELIQEGGNTLCSEICKLISIWNKEELPQHWKESTIVPIYKRVIKLTVIIIEEYHCYQLHTKSYPIFLSQA